MKNIQKIAKEIFKEAQTQTFMDDALKQIFEWAKRDFNINNVEVNIQRDSIWIQSKARSKRGSGAHGQLVIRPFEYKDKKTLSISGVIEGKIDKNKFYLSPINSFTVKDLEDVKKLYDEKAKPVAKLFYKEYEKMNSKGIFQTKIKAIQNIIDGQTNLINTLHSNWGVLTEQEKREYQQTLKFRDERNKELDELKKQI